MGLMLYWHDFGISKQTIALIERLRLSIGGIGIGIFICLLLSGQYRKIRERPAAAAVADIEGSKSDTDPSNP